MTTLTIDTHKAVTSLKQAGYSDAQAQGFVEVIKQAELHDTATKTDLHDLRADLYKFILTIAVAQTALTVALIQLLST